MTRLAAIRKYFEPPKVTLDELKALSLKERTELAESAARELGVKLDKPKAISEPR